MFLDQRIRFHLIQQQLPPPPARVFEVGCGNGELLRELRRLGYDARGCELSAAAVEQAKATDIGPFVFQASGTGLPVADNAYDAVLSSDVLEHVPPDQRSGFLTEMLRITRPLGRVVLSYWSRNNLPFRLYGAYHLWRRGNLPQWYIEHITLVPPVIAEVESWMAGKGRLLAAREYQGPVNMLLCCIDHLHFQRLPRFHRFLARHYRRVLALDRFGGCSSQVIALEKPRDA